MKKLLFILLISSIFLLGCVEGEESTVTFTDRKAELSDKSLAELRNEIVSFNELNLDICTNDEGKPIIRLFSTTTCPHCTWIKDTYSNTVMEYVNAGFIEAYLWEVDARYNHLTPQREGTIPANEIQIFRTYNDRGSVPTYVFGCKYYRIGNAFSAQNDLASEEAEFRRVIEALIKENKLLNN